jgi:hypothetical protein
LGYEVINLGCNHPHALSELISRIEKQAGRQALLEYQPSRFVDVVLAVPPHRIVQCRTPGNRGSRFVVNPKTKVDWDN